ncbi:MAG: lysine exporter LysO family protein [Odoribacter sp.]|nr:lysine exporter LysO family protein [Odoribacter sp.]
MLTVVGIMLAGVCCGFCLRKRNLKWVSYGVTIAIWVLLFSLGISVGNNEAILNNLDTIGWQALVMSTVAVLGSVVLSAVVYHVFFKNQEK